MAGFKVSPATTPTRPSGRGANAKKDPLGTFLSFKSSRVSLLKRQSSAGTQYQTTCISKHYELNHQVYEAFRIHYYNLSGVIDTNKDKNTNNNNNNTNSTSNSNSSNNNNNIDTAKSNFDWISTAFCLGWNFVETALLDLPTHGYFYSNGDPQIVKLRKRSSVVALEVTRLLQRILKLMESMTLNQNQNNNNNNNTYHNNNNNESMDDERNNTHKDPRLLRLLEDKNRDECKRKLATLKLLAKEQLEHIDTYEAKRLGIVAKWRVPNPESVRVVGNHRAFSKTGRRDPSDNDNDTEPTTATATMLDCETISRIFCPTALPDPPPPVRNVSVPFKPVQTVSFPFKAQPPPPLPKRNFRRPSLADREEDDGSDFAVFDSPTSSSSNNNNININNPANDEPLGERKRSDDAVFLPQRTSSSKSKVETSDRQAPSPDRSSASNSNSTSTTSTGRRRKTPNSKKKQTKDGSSSSTKKSGKRYTNRLFGKKSNARNQQQQQQQHKQQHEETVFQEALYQSEIEAAKAASIREEETKNLLYHCNSDYSSRDGSSGIHPPDTQDLDLQQALYLSELEAAVQQSFEANQQGVEKRDDSGGEGRTEEGVTRPMPAQVIVKGVPVATGPPGAVYRCRNDPYDLLKVIKACCRKDFERLREQKKVLVTRISTYQGRIQGSTNGCTVIAPLLCAHYFKTPTTNDLPPARLSDEKILSVIDSECPSLLPDIRKSLGVSKNAFLIPHDAHEHLIESKHMDRDQFVTVCGGNILEEGHLGALVKELSTTLPDGKKLGATFFFHQHVIAILQLRDPDTKEGKTSVSFDIIDSLPNKSTLPLPPASPISDKVSDKLLPQPPNCARIFCKDALSLKATLKWYACSVFTRENERYIDDYHWDEKMTDFDPRVFQAFVWKEI